MNARRLLSYVLVAAAAGTGGFFLGRPGDASTPPGNRLKPEPNTVELRLPAAGMVPASIAKIVGDEPLTAANATNVMFRVLESADPVNRMAAVGLLLESMTPSNAPGIYQAFRDITTKTGRRHDMEWTLMLKRYGEVMGKECFKQLLPEPQNLALAIEGWASVDPEGVLTAIKEAHITDTRYDNAWLVGVCRKDPEKALTLALSGEYPVLDGTALINQAIHTSGLNGANEALQRALDAASVDATSPALQNVFNAFAETMFHKNWTDGTPDSMLKWLEEQKGEPYLTPQIVDKGARNALMQGDAGATIAWLKRMNEGNEGEITGAKGIMSAIFEKPDILAKMNDAAFTELLPMLPKTASSSFRAMAKMIEQANPVRADQLRTAAPPDAAPPESAQTTPPPP
ncbi:MAG TPA: hypothetical protein VG796_26555 [Verrucomicrobiales bacterium]|jgi:hypothetical protein|nr:hypothetical protein [Verrucomicrobiales bacterium]